MPGDIPYGSDWDRYSQDWEASHGGEHRHLGDEWKNRELEEVWFDLYTTPFVRADHTVLEVAGGPHRPSGSVTHGSRNDRAHVAA